MLQMSLISSLDDVSLIILAHTYPLQLPIDLTTQHGIMHDANGQEHSFDIVGPFFNHFDSQSQFAVAEVIFDFHKARIRLPGSSDLRSLVASRVCLVWVCLALAIRFLLLAPL